MHLSVTCPRCESKYQLDAGMRGKRMRCPNTICRAVFEAREDNDPLPESSGIEAKAIESPIPPAPPTTEAERKVETKEPTAPEAKRPAAVKPKQVPKPLEPVPDFPDDFPGDDEAAPAPSIAAIATEAWQPEAWETPPVRESPAPTPLPMVLQKKKPAPRRRRRALMIIAAMLLMLGLVAGVGYWRLRGTIQSNEAERFQHAERLYKDREFAEASVAFQKLHRDFPDSPHNKKYRFLAELSDVRQSAQGGETSEETAKALERVLQFAGMFDGDPLLKEHGSDLWQTLQSLADELTKLSEREKSLGLLPIARRAMAEAKKYPAPAGARPRDLDAEWTRIQKVLEAHVERQQVVAAIKNHLVQTTAVGVQEVLTMIERTKRQDDAEIRGLLNDLYKAHRDQVKFVPTRPEENKVVPAGDALPNLSVTLSLAAERSVKTGGPPVLALARGVLYALDPGKGDLRWARRVGIDTHVLPLRVPADTITPELVLAVSSDQRSLTAVILATGEPLWQTLLSNACVGTPVIVDRQVLVPTLGGQIEEIELAEGRRLGAYHVGQPLILGGLRQTGTSLVYFPADELCLYEFDVTKRACTNILYTRHPAGSLRGLPAIGGADKESWLLWCQASGLDRAELKPFALPIQGPEQKPADPIVPLLGLSAPPWFGADRWAYMTEAGSLAPWGVKQMGNRDLLLFPILKQDFPVDRGNPSGRCEVAHADAENYWTMTRGRLQRIRSVFDPAKGPRLLMSWPQPVPLGNLLHSAQTRQEPDGRTILFLTTQASDHPACLASAVEAETGKILWQRQLGALPQQTPLVVKEHILLSDPHGLLRFDPAQPAEKSSSLWSEAGARILRHAASDASRLLLVRENTYVQLTWLAGSLKLRIEVGVTVGSEAPRAMEIALPASLQGTPALADGFLLLPLANGILVRVSLQESALVNGPDWRAGGAEEQARGHVAVLTPQEFIVTDGSRGLERLFSADGKFWDKRASSQLPHRILAAPVLVPSADKVRLCVLDASDTVTLFDPERLSVLKRWSMPGKVTAGPFLRAGKIGCVVAKTRLVWLDPTQDAPAWEYTFVAEIVGEPHVIEGKLVIADVAGQMAALDPANGSSLGPVLRLRANVAPTAAPVPFGPGRAFVPLTDGTIVILPLEKLLKSNEPRP